MAQAGTAMVETKADAKLPGGGVLTISMSQQFPDNEHELGKFRISATDSDRPFVTAQLPAEVAAVLSVAADARTEAQRKSLADYFRSQDSQWVQLRDAARIAEDQKSKARLMGTQDLVWALINNAAFLFNR
jgi:hypothetical protein